MKENKTNWWKIATIILAVIFIIETCFIGWIIKAGTDVINNENECSINICEPYDTYYFDPYDNICYCYRDHEIVYQEYIK